MPEVGIATGAVDFDTHHAVAAILLGRDRIRGHAIPETRPACSGVELGGRTEQRYITADAVIHPRFLVIPVRTGEGSFSATAASHLILLRCQRLHPLLGGTLDPLGHY